VRAIRAARLFDGLALVPLERPTVLVDGGRVVAVRPGEAPIGGAALLDLGEATLLPGLVDTHVHLCFDAGADPVGSLAAAGDEEALARMRAAARATLASGVTTARDLGDRGYLAVRLRDELAGDPAAGPEVLASGPPITTTGGHCWFLGGEADGADALRAAVRERADRSVDVVKIIATGGELTPGTPVHEAQYGPDELRAAVDEAHRRGLPVAVHAHGVPGIANAVAAGVDTIEHCSFATADGAGARPELIDAIVRSGAIVSATVGFLPGAALSPEAAARLPGIVDAFRRMRAAGVPIACGSDAGISPDSPHGVLPYAAEVMAGLGFTPVETLRSMTSLAAGACRVAGRKGRVAPGFDADLLAVDGDPTTAVAALRAVAAVFRAGHRVR
jgi:imidazolonepropionase-like amidohydrolase